MGYNSERRIAHRAGSLLPVLRTPPGQRRSTSNSNKAAKLNVAHSEGSLDGNIMEEWQALAAQMKLEQQAEARRVRKWSELRRLHDVMALHAHRFHTLEGAMRSVTHGRSLVSRSQFVAAIMGKFKVSNSARQSSTELVSLLCTLMPP